MDVDAIRNFLVVAQLGNMTKAAARLNLTQPALSGQVKRLEGELGNPLFDRHGRGLRLTAAGEAFRRHAAEAVRSLERGREALAALGGLQAGTIAVGGGATSTTCLLPTVIGRFHGEHPGIRIHLREAPSRTITEAVIAGDLDLGVITLPVPSVFSSARLTVTPWLLDELVLLAPPAHPLAQRRRFRWKDLDGQPLIAFESGSAVRQLLDRQLADHAVTPSVVMELRSIATITSLVAAGVGLGFVSRLADAGRKGLRCGDRPLSRQLALVEREDRGRSPAVAAFRAALLEYRPE